VKLTVTTCSPLLFLLLCIHSYAQGENNNWCFGIGGGLSFNTGSPVFFASSMAAIEGAVTVSDANGNLLFYASPNVVWNRAHYMMPNGSGLRGSASSSDGAAVVRSYVNPNQYYVFTTGAEGMWPTGTLCYSVVDISLDGGLGDVVSTQKNILLDTSTSEKIAVVRGAGCYTWLLVHKRSSPIFNAYKIDSSGFNPVPVNSNSGSHSFYGTGQMKISSDGSIIALASQYLDKFLEIHYFNKETGVVSNGITLETEVNPSDEWYGICFSPDDKKLYASTVNVVRALYQYDLSQLPNIDSVRASRYLISMGKFDGMRLGPDRKIYISTLDSCISVINNPNVKGPGSGLSFFMSLPTVAKYGLGTALVHQDVIDVKIDNEIVPCGANFLRLDAGVDSATYRWQDGSSERTYNVTKPGDYTVTVAKGECSVARSAKIEFDDCQCHIALPDAFSPNNDGKNDKFGPTISCAATSYKLAVYNRWGNCVFHSQDLHYKWDGSYKGTPLASDVFYYYCQFTDSENKVHNYKGDVTLLR